MSHLEQSVMTVVTGSLKEFVGKTSASIVLLTFLVLSKYTKRWHTQQQSRGILRSARNCSTVLWRNLRSARLYVAGVQPFVVDALFGHSHACSVVSVHCSLGAFSNDHLLVFSLSRCSCCSWLSSCLAKASLSRLLCSR